MKTSILSFVLGTLMLGAAHAADTQPPHVSVTGAATIEVTPDEMLWVIQAQTLGPNLEAVAANHAKTVQTTLHLLKDTGVDEKSIQTSRMQFGENWDYNNSSRVRNGFTASTSISFKLTDFDLYDKVWLALAKTPELSVEGVSYDHSKRIDFQNEARQKAILAARDKAAAMARTLGCDIGQPLQLEEDTPEPRPMMMSNYRMAGGAAQSAEDIVSLAPGKIPVTVRVQATFQLLPGTK